MDPTITVIIARALERILVIACGMLAVWAGYKLFSQVQTTKDGEGRLSLPGGITFFVSKVGPGVFFALFGTVMIGYSASQPVTYSEKEGYSGLAPVASQREPLPQRPAPPIRTPAAKEMIRYLNELYLSLPSDLDPSLKSNWRLAVREAKLALLRENWSTDKWGDYTFFHDWITVNRQTGSLDESFTEAKDIFNQGGGQP